MPDYRSRRATLSVHRAFVVHFADAAGSRRRRFCGRAEHLSSGAVATFSSLRELLAFFDSATAAPPPCEGQASVSTRARE
jgi:hypothetical protein